MESKQKKLYSQYMGERDRIEMMLTNLSADCFEFFTYKCLLNRDICLPNNWIRKDTIFERAFEHMVLHLSELQGAYERFVELHKKLTNKIKIFLKNS